MKFGLKMNSAISGSLGQFVDTLAKERSFGQIIKLVFRK